jgi:hypothetical protein
LCYLVSKLELIKKKEKEEEKEEEKKKIPE